MSPGDPNVHDQSMACGSKFAACQRTMGQHLLSGHGPITSGNRLVPPRMLSGCGGGSERNLPLPGELELHVRFHYLFSFITHAALKIKHRLLPYSY